MPLDRRFQTMGVRARIWLADGSDELADRLVARVQQLEQRWSRFIETSDTCRMNATPGEAVTVHADTIDLTRHCLAAARDTKGHFDPLLGREIVAAGYHLPFEQLAQEPTTISRVPTATLTVASPRSTHERPTTMSVDAQAMTVTVPPGAAFDPGALGKGRAADLVADEAIFCGAPGVFVDIGGDVRMAGEAPAGRWPLHVEDPRGGDPLATLGLPSSGVATTSVRKRRWTTSSGPQHHVLDPRTAQPTTSDLVSLTVLAAETWWADAVSTAGVVGGRDVAVELMRESGSSGMWVTVDGDVGYTPGFEHYLAV